jgi:hypothetical protein
VRLILLLFFITPIGRLGAIQIDLNTGIPAFPSKVVEISDLEGCRIMPAKCKSEQSNEIIASFTHDRGLWVQVYEPGKVPGYLASEIMEIQTWHGLATVEVVSGPNQKDMLKVLSEGNTGTNTLQMIETWIQWDGARFRVILCETKEYALTLYPACFLYGNFSFASSWEGDHSRFYVNAKYLEKQREGKEFSEYQEQLDWNPKTFSFYTVERETKKALSKRPLIRALSNARLKLVEKDWNMKKMWFGEVDEVMSVIQCR